MNHPDLLGFLALVMELQSNSQILKYKHAQNAIKNYHQAITHTALIVDHLLFDHEIARASLRFLHI